MDVAKNFAKVTIVVPVEQSDITIQIDDGHGARLPDTPFNAVVWNATDFPDPSDDPDKEIVRVTDNTLDILTVERGQEETGDVDHDAGGKTYNLMACLTAKVINEDILGDIHGTGVAVLIDLDAGSIRLRLSSGRFLDLGSVAIEIQSTILQMGDVEGVGNATSLSVDDDNNRILSVGKLATDQIASASIVVGTLTGKVPWHDASNNLIGYMPLYSSIT